MGRDDYSQSSQLSTLVGKPVSRYTKLPKNTDTLRKLTDVKVKPNNRFHYSIYPSVETEYQASYSQLTNLDFYSPVITILGDNPYSHLRNTPFTDPGVTLDETSTLVSNVSTVNTNAFGTFGITYVATDGINPDTTKVRIVKVGEYPVVTIEGDNPYTLERYDPYDDEGVDVDANSSVTSTTSSVNNTAVGAYTVNYTVSNPVFTTFHTRIVNVVDTTPPVVTILGDNPYTLERFDVYTDPGATGDLGTIVTPDLSNVQNTSIGSFVVVYNATDGNTLHDVAVTRTVNVVDTLPPVVTILGDNPYTLERFDVYTDPGATVDRGTILTTDLTAVNNTLPHGSSFVVTYTGSDGNTLHDVTQTRTVNIVDTKPPVITLLGDNPYEMQPGIDFRDVDPLYEVDLGTSVSIDYSNVVTTDNSVYYVVYRASDGVNPDAVVLRRVAVADTLPAIITIIGDNPYTLERYAEYVDPGATTDTEAGSRFVSITNNVDNTAVGSYTVTYVATDDINLPPTTAERIVNVVDTTAPIVTLNGASSVTLERYGVFADIDEGVEIEAPGSLVSVDTSQLDNTTQGTYTVTYNVVDDQNNANVITREVVVQDTVPPVVTLNNESTFYTLERYGVWADIDPGVTVDEGSYVYSVNVDNTAIGNQSVEYIVKDGTNQTDVFRTIRVVDTLPPIITVNEPDYVHEIYTQYIDPGATADAGSILTVDTSNADVSNTTNIGTFDVVYSATDGNTAHDVTVIRTVTVSDTTPPVASLQYESYTTERFGTYVDPGDSDIILDEGSFVAGTDLSNVDTSITHGSSFDVVYDIADSNALQNVNLIRSVTVVDTVPPVITVLGTPLITLERYAPIPDFSTTVSLDEGSYLTSVNIDALDNTVVGSYSITYNASDGVNDTQLNRTVQVSDTVSPVITINGANPYYVERFSTFNDPYASADPGSTLFPADLSNVNMDGVHNSTFDVVYTATDGNTTSQAVRTVVVVDTVPPVITITDGDYSIERFSTYSERGVTVDEGSIYFGSDTSNVDESLVHGNTFDIVYTAYDGNNFSKAIRTITVVDTVPPIASLNGQSPYEMGINEIWDDYEPGLTLSPGDFIESVDYSQFDNTAYGTSTITYNLSDGPNSNVITRNVDIVHRDLTLTGSSITLYTTLNNYNVMSGIDISYDSQTIVVGDAYQPYVTGGRYGYLAQGQGIINILTKSGTTWNLQSLQDPSPTDGDAFGQNVFISNDGNTILVAAPQATISSVNNVGYVSIYIKNNNSWSRAQRINSGSVYSSAYFGEASTLSGDGNYVIVGNDSQYATLNALMRVYHRSGNSWSLQQTINTNRGYVEFIDTDYDGNTIVCGVNDGSTSTQYVYIYTRSNNTFSLQQTLSAPSSMVSDFIFYPSTSYYCRYGAITPDGNTVVCGMEYIYDSNYNSHPGLAFYNKNSSGTWTQTQALIDYNSSTFVFAQTISRMSKHGNVFTARNYTDGGMYIIARDSTGVWSNVQTIPSSHIGIVNGTLNNLTFAGGYATGAPLLRPLSIYDSP